MRIIVDGSAPGWAHDLAREVDLALASISTPLRYTVAKLPPPLVEGAVVYVVDDVDGPVLAFADGQSWRRVTDRGIVS